jgi:predicted PhzF superfamily epimerase YddE/YHI9
MCLPAISISKSERPEVAPLLGVAPMEVWLSPDRYGIYLIENERQLRVLKPDFGGLAALGNDQFICTALGEHSDIVSRVFAPGGGTDEDSVTGSAHAALAPFWASRLGRDEMTAHQASRRGGDLTLRLERRASGDRVWIGGDCVTVAEGQFHLSG